MRAIALRDGARPGSGRAAAHRGVRSHAGPGSALHRQTTATGSDAVGISSGMVSVTADMPAVLPAQLSAVLTQKRGARGTLAA